MSMQFTVTLVEFTSSIVYMKFHVQTCQNNEQLKLEFEYKEKPALDRMLCQVLNI